MPEAAKRARARAERHRKGEEGHRVFAPNVIAVFLGELGDGITEANDAFLDLTGYARADLPLSWNVMTSADSRVPDDGTMEALLHDGGASSWETEILTRSGSRIPVLIVAARPTETGRQYVAFVLDLTRTKDLEIALRRGEERFWALYDHSPMVCLTVARDGAIVAISAHGADRLGYGSDELAGVSVFELLHQQDRGILREQLDGAWNQTGAEVSRDLRYIRKDGEVVLVRGSAHVMPDRDGQLLVLLTGEDLREDREGEERLLAYQMRLRTLTLESALAEERQRRRIALGLHDDVGHSLALARMKLAACRRDDGKGSDRELGEARSLIDHAIQATRALTFDLSPPILYELGLEAALESLGERLVEPTGVRFGYASDGQPKPLSPEATVLLYRSVYELLRNVVKHAQARSVNVAVTRVQNRIELAISDDGVGFDPVGLSERRGRERGYGLFSIREQLRAIGGHLDVESAPGRGTTCLLRVLLESPAV